MYKRKELSVITDRSYLNEAKNKSQLDQISHNDFSSLSEMIESSAVPQKAKLEKNSSALSGSGDRTPLAEITNKSFSDLSIVESKTVNSSSARMLSPKISEETPPRSGSQSQSTYKVMQSLFTPKASDSTLSIAPTEKKRSVKSPMLGVVNVSPKPNSKNDFFDRYGISSEQDMYKGNYKLPGMRDGLYAWVKSKVDVVVKGKNFPAGTIFCRNKGGIDGGSDHRGLAKQVNLAEDDSMTKSNFVEAGGVILIKNGKIEEWNCRTGRYSGVCNLKRQGVEVSVGLPVDKYKTFGYEGTSPVAATGMVQRIFGSIAAFERASSQPAARKLKKSRPAPPSQERDLSFNIASEESSSSRPGKTV